VKYLYTAYAPLNPQYTQTVLVGQISMGACTRAQKYLIKHPRKKGNTTKPLSLDSTSHFIFFSLSHLLREHVRTRASSNVHLLAKRRFFPLTTLTGPFL
jgi:hypothetical protein